MGGGYVYIQYIYICSICICILYTYIDGVFVSECACACRSSREWEKGEEELPPCFDGDNGNVKVSSLLMEMKTEISSVSPLHNIVVIVIVIVIIIHGQIS